MKRSSSNCFRVSISLFPSCGGRSRLAETNHEQTLYVRYVFCNHLIWREQLEGPPKATLNGSARGPDAPPRLELWLPWSPVALGSPRWPPECPGDWGWFPAALHVAPPRSSYVISANERHP